MGLPLRVEGTFLVHLKYTVAQMGAVQVSGNTAPVVRCVIAVIRCNQSLNIYFEPVRLISKDYSLPRRILRTEK